MALITGLTVGVATAILVAEIKAWGPWVIRSLVKFAVRRLPESQRARFDEEWRSYLNEIPGQIGKLVAAVGFLIAACDSTLNEVRQRAWAPLLAQLDDLESRTVAYISAIQIDETLASVEPYVSLESLRSCVEDVVSGASEVQRLRDELEADIAAPRNLAGSLWEILHYTFIGRKLRHELSQRIRQHNEKCARWIIEIEQSRQEISPFLLSRRKPPTL